MNIRECVFLATTFYALLTTFHLGIYTATSYIIATSGQSLNQIQTIFIVWSILFTIMSIIIGAIWKYYSIEAVARLAKEPKFSEMISAISVFMVVYCSFDTFSILYTPPTFELLQIAFFELLLNIALFYQLLRFMVKFIDANVYQQKFELATSEYEQIAAQAKQLYEEVHRDDLTTLYNRKYVFSLLEEMCANYTNTFALFFIDINALKKVNDTFGHGEGDEYILTIANVIKDSFRTDDVIARIGGDEFLIVCKDMTQNKVDVILERLVNNMQVKSEKETRYSVSASSGAILVTQERAARGHEYIISEADSEMIKEKESHRKRRDN
ncbi:MAG: GGDEF domain-containing protein [Culicoidibacterales bacterium]